MNRTILEHFTAVDTDINALDKQVDSFVKKGCQPCGNPYVIPGEKIQVCQADGSLPNLPFFHPVGRSAD